MTRQTWKKGNLYISYGNPVITPYPEVFDENGKISDISEAMYFYYSLNIFRDNKELFSAGAYDFPKVDFLPRLIDNIIGFDMDKAMEIKNVENKHFTIRRKYAQVLLEDNFDLEYFYKIERYDHYTKYVSDEHANEWSEYILTIGEMEQSKGLNDKNKEDYGKSITIKGLTLEDLKRLKDTAKRFCEGAVALYNKQTLS